MKRSASCIVAALAAVTMLASCGTGESPHGSVDQAALAALKPLSELTPVDNPRTYEGPSTAILEHQEIEPVEANPAQKLPATMASNDRSGDVQVTVKDTDRVLALDMSGSLAATVWGLGFGKNLVGRDISTEFPGTEKLPLVTVDGHSINAEAVLKLKPSVVITDGAIGPRDVVEQLRDAGIAVVFVATDQSFKGAQDMARRVGAVFGAPEAGEKLANRIAADVKAAGDEIKRFVPTKAGDKVSIMFLYLRGTSGVYYLFGKESGVSDLVARLGGVDVATKLGWKGMRPLTDEAMVGADPDLILVMTGGLESVGGVDGLLKEKPAIELTAAGTHRRIVDMADGDVLSFGPRSGDVLRALARAIYAPQG